MIITNWDPISFTGDHLSPRLCGGEYATNGDDAVKVRYPVPGIRVLEFWTNLSAIEGFRLTPQLSPIKLEFDGDYIYVGKLVEIAVVAKVDNSDVALCHIALREE